MGIELSGGLVLRAGVLRAIRAFFDARGFVEVETPVRIGAPAPEPHIDCPMVVESGTGNPEIGPGGGAGDRRSFLRASPELQMKKLLARGMEKIWQMGPCFREGERGSRHNPEFTMLEWYRAGAGYLDILDDMERLVTEVLSSFPSGSAALRGGGDLPLSGGFARLTVRDAYQRYAGWDPFVDWDQDRFDFDMATKIEPSLPRGPVFLMDYPPQAASLSKLRGGVAERWELYVGGMELANAFTELTDAREQRIRFEQAREERRRLGEADYPLDEEFLRLLQFMSPSGGVALGVDRLVMLAAGAVRIDDIRVL